MAKRILCVLGNLRAGGVESIMFSYYRFLDKEKYQYDFLYEEGSKFDVPDEILALGARAYKIPPVKKPVKYVKEVCRIIKEGKYSIVHSNMNTLSVFSLFAALLCGVKYRVLHNHTTSSPVEKKRDLVKKLLRPFNTVLANKPCACSELAARWMYGDRAFEKGKVQVFRNGVDVDRFKFNLQHREEIRREFGIGDKKLIGHIGRFMTQKNHFFLVDLFCKCVEKDENSILMLVGGGELFDSVKSYVTEKGIADKVIFAGFRDDTYKLYSAFDVFVLPSFYEGLPVVGMEACASGLPLLLSDKITKECAVTDAVEFLPIDDPSVWAEKLCNIAVMDREAIAMQMKDGPYDIRRCVRDMEDYYSTCI